MQQWTNNSMYKLKIYLIEVSRYNLSLDDCDLRFNLILFTIHDCDFSCFIAVKNREVWM